MIGQKDMSPPTHNWRKRRTEHRFYAEIVTDIITKCTTRTPLIKTGEDLEIHRQHWEQVKNSDKHNTEN